MGGKSDILLRPAATDCWPFRARRGSWRWLLVQALLLGCVLAIALVTQARAADGEPSLIPTGKTPPKLIPFPEDEQDAPAAKPAPVRVTPPKGSNFQPRFKTPPVRAAQHAEPTEAVAPTAAEESRGPQLQPMAAPTEAQLSPDPAAPDQLPRGPVSPGQALVDEAFAKSKQAKTDENYTAVIELCQRGVKTGVGRSYEEYTRRLLSWTYNRRGEVRERAGQKEQALADFEAAVKSNGNSWRALHNRAVSLAAQGRMRDAMVDFDRTIELNPRYGNAYFNRGELKYQHNDIKGAIADYTAALQATPHDPSILNSRGHAFYRIERFGDALRDYSDALKANPKYAPALINRGDTHSDLGHYSEAASDYRSAVEADPKLAKAYQSAAWLMATCPDDHYRNPKLSVEAALKAIELSGDVNYRCLETLAAAQASAGQFAEAQDTQEKAIAQAPRNETTTAEKRLALYKHAQTYRERPRVAFNAPAEEDQAVRKASGTTPARDARRPASNRPR